MLVFFCIVLGTWLVQARYPHTIYQYHQTDDIVAQYDYRIEGYRIELMPIWTPDNPTWVNLSRKWSPFIMFALAIALISLEANFRERRRLSQGILPNSEFIP